MTAKLKITADMLREHDACQDQVDLFEEVFPNGAVVPDDIEKAGKAGLATGWAFKVFKLTGVAERWYENGQQWYRWEYRNGKRHGVYEGWHANGQQSYRREYRDDKRHGVAERWYANGQQWYRWEYRDGKLIRNLMEEDK